MTDHGPVLKWQGGGEATIAETDGVHATLQSTRQAAPGTPLWADVPLMAGRVVRFKVKACRRLGDQSFELRGRWVDLPKRIREELVSAVR